MFRLESAAHIKHKLSPCVQTPVKKIPTSAAAWWRLIGWNFSKQSTEKFLLGSCADDIVWSHSISEDGAVALHSSTREGTQLSWRFTEFLWQLITN